MGIYEIGIRQELLKNIQEYRQTHVSKWDTGVSV